MGKAKKLKAIRKALRENTDDTIQWQQKIVHKDFDGQTVDKRILRHDPHSRKGKYKAIKKQGDYGEDE